jgi:molybdopterin-guanine dinucleotide biosynthesis protein A
MGTDKGLVLYGEKPLIQYSIDLAKEVCADIIIGTNNSEYSRLGYQLVSDIISDKGPISGLHAVMKTVDSDYFFVLSCDIPHATLNIARSMSEELGKFDIIVPVWGKNKIEPLFGFYSRTILPVVERQIDKENFKLLDLLKECNTLYFNIDSTSDGSVIFKNINSPADVRK